MMRETRITNTHKLPENSSIDFHLVSWALLFRWQRKSKGLQGEKARGLSHFPVSEKRFSSRDFKSRCSRQGSAHSNLYLDLRFWSQETSPLSTRLAWAASTGAVRLLSRSTCFISQLPEVSISPGNSPKIPPRPRGV